MTITIYIAGPMFSQAEKRYNEEICEHLEELGYRTFLPQREASDVDDLLRSGLDWDQVNQQIFEEDTKGIRNSDIVLFVMDGRVPDDGACVEIGYGYALGKECIGLKTDPRSFMSDYDNSMIVGALKNRIARNTDELLSIIREIALSPDAASQEESS
ncbi:MAG: nucleoside 2-deoxyribosyltransferase [Methanomassiliicoccales archaeon]|jgi:nucleoside 2-deoxyribosyltransferase|nr:nucleoside 2-deoxyribosyltransferase [Methanomassiliicoccales archaeon]NYT15619.1 nucleoside 2-deoxyribosyltransferase [Methanomassiliicoccales archaeon]